MESIEELKATIQTKEEIINALEKKIYDLTIDNQRRQELITSLMLKLGEVR